MTPDLYDAFHGSFVIKNRKDLEPFFDGNDVTSAAPTAMVCV